MTLREAMKLLDLNERTLDISMLDSAARQRMDAAETSLQRDQVLEAYRRVQIFLDPSADERFAMRGSNVLAALSETRVASQAIDDDEHGVVLVEDEPESQPPAALSFEPANFDLDLEFNFEAADEPNIRTTAELPLLPFLEPDITFGLEPENLNQVLPDSLPAMSDITLPAMSDMALPAMSEVASPIMSDISPDWSALQPILEPKPAEAPSEFDDSLLTPAPKPRVVSDETSLTIIEEISPTDPTKPAIVVKELEPSQAPIRPVPPRSPTTPVSPAPTKTTKNSTTVKNGNPERRISRATQAAPVSRAYEKRRQKANRQPPLWAWLLAIATLVSTGIFAAPALIKQFSPKAKPQVNLSVPNLPQAPKPVIKPVVQKPSSSIAKPKPVVKPVVAKPKPVVKPVVADTPKPSVTTLVKPVVIPKPVAKPIVKPVVKPTPVVKPKPSDPRSAAVLPPIGAKPVAVKPKPVAVKPKPVAVKPKPTVLRFEDPAPKPSAPAAIPAPVVTTPAPVTEVVDPNNLTREQIGRRFLNEKYYADWLSRGAQLKYPNWADIPIATQVLAFADFKSTVLIALP